MLAARGFRFRRLRIVVGSGDRGLVRVDIGRDDDLRAGLQALALADAVRLHDDVGGNAEAARQVVNRLAFLDGHPCAAGARPALDVALFGHRRLGLDRAGRGRVDRLHRRGGSGLDRLGGRSACNRRRQGAAADRAGVTAVGLCGRDRLRVAGIGLGAGGVAAWTDDLALVGGRGGHEVVDAAEARDLGTAPGGDSASRRTAAPCESFSPLRFKTLTCMVTTCAYPGLN